LAAASEAASRWCREPERRSQPDQRVSIIAWIVLGLVGGAVVGWLWGRRGRMLLGDIVVAVLGAILGGFMASVLLGLDVTQIEGVSLGVAALGAAILIAILHALPAADIFAD
jgi:uncharacterized membrane protein YeaQ/YmgE (transglycosylase-associated protein family)